MPENTYQLSYTGQQVDEAIGKALAGLPTITIAVSQVILQSPLQIQLTDEQYQILANNKQVILDGTALGVGDLVATYAGKVANDDLLFMLPTISVKPGDVYREFYAMMVETSDKTAVLKQTTLDVYAINNEGPSYDGEVAMAILGEEEVRWGLNWGFPYRISYTTTAPSSANTTGTLQIVVLSSEPANRYDGYLYIITGSN